jgi:antitoxin VapB
VSLNIKNPEAVKLARELARENGETITTAITTALRERLERQRQAASQEQRMKRLKEIVERTAPIMKDLPPSTEIGDLLYDQETGLPK